MPDSEPHSDHGSNPIRLLCFDGGGVRGLASLCLLRQIMSQTTDQKPCEFFHMIAGTSTGGLIAIMLGRLEMNIDDCIKAYIEIMQEVFKQRNRILINPFTTGVLPKYEVTILKDKILQIIRQARLPEETRFRGGKKCSCKTVVTSLATKSSEVVHFTDWEKAGEHSDFYNQVKIWEVALATTAASSFFEPAHIYFHGLKLEYSDAGIKNNNPIFNLWNEAANDFGQSFRTDLQIMLSIGTGKPPPKKFGTTIKKMAKSIIEIASNTEEAHKNFVIAHPGLKDRGIYHRFNAPYLIEHIELDDYKDADTIQQTVEAYGNEDDTKRQFAAFRRAAMPPRIPDQGENTQMTPPQAFPIRLLPPPKYFYHLGEGPQFIKSGVKCYWAHLTLESIHLYEQVYEKCKCVPERRPSGCIIDRGHVHFSQFLQQFNLETNSERSIKAIWMRLIRDPQIEVQDSIFPQGFVLAVLYMIHLESKLPSKRPLDDLGRPGGIKFKRRKAMIKWKTWVRCSCDRNCGLEWNFANDDGLHRGAVGKNGCQVLRYVESSAKVLMQNEKKRWEATRYSWDQSE